MATSISSGSVYIITTDFHVGGAVSAGEPGIRALSLVKDAGWDAEKWILHAGSEPDSYTIENFRRRSHFATENSANEFVFQDDTQQEPTMWYIKQADYIESVLDPRFNYHICRTPDCSTYWVPSQFNAEPPGEEQEDTISLRNKPLAGHGWELWRFGPADVEVSSIADDGETLLPSVTTTNPLPTSITTRAEQTPPRSSATGSIEQQQKALKDCAPCGSTQCTFTPSGEPQQAVYSVLIGQPVSNCAKGSQETTTTKFGGTYQLQNSWSVEVSITAGFGFMGPSISSTVTGTTGGSELVIQTQEVEVSIRPGQMGALVANISYATQPGQVNVDDSTLAFVSVQPKYVLGYSVVYADCSSNFQAITVPKVECGGALSSHYFVLTSQVMLLWTLLVAMGSFIA